MHRKKSNFASVPSSNGVIMVQRNEVAVASLEFGKFFLVVVNNDGVCMLVFIE